MRTSISKRRRSEEFRIFLRRLPAAWARTLVKDCERDLADLNLGSPADFEGVHGGGDADPRKAIGDDSEARKLRRQGPPRGQQRRRR